MASAESIQPDGKFMGLFIGRSGSGKTAAALSFPHPIKVLDLDQRIRGGLMPWIVKKGIDYDSFPPKQQGIIFTKLNEVFTTLQVGCNMGTNVYETLVVDSITWAAIDLLLDAMPLTHSGSSSRESGKKIGTMEIAGPSDYQFQSTGIYQILAFLKSLPIKNIIVTAHIVNKWGRKKNSEGKIIDPYGPSEIIGDQLSLTDKLAENVPSSFDHVFLFEKVDTGSSLRFTFSAHGDLERTPFDIPYGRQDITGKSFYETLMVFAKKESV
jgi:AAA domain